MMDQLQVVAAGGVAVCSAAVGGAAKGSFADASAPGV